MELETIESAPLESGAAAFQHRVYREDGIDY